MCGINGIYNFTREKISMKPEILAMNQALRHRGPDDKGVWLNREENLILGQTRLSILDLSISGHQPMVDQETGNTLTFNGEIFNYKQLNSKFFKDEKFKSQTDTETILKMFRKFGFDSLEKLNGMFAFGIWDEKNEELVLARDRSGKKPLYYTEQAGKFIFSSELRSILELPYIERKLDEKAFYDFLTYNTVLSPSTMFQDVKKFLPGHYMRVNKYGIKEYKPYHNLRKKEVAFETEKDLENLVFSKLEESVSSRMISDVPVGAFLSGGVDSSAIVALMRQNTSAEIKTFTVGFENQPNYSELEFAEKIAKKYNTNHYVKNVGPQDLLEFIPKIAEIYDEPQADTTAIPIHFISQLAKDQGIKVVLNGDGPDELFSGYSNYSKYIRINNYFSLAERMPQVLKKIIHETIGKGSKGKPLFEMTSRLRNQQDLYWPGASGLKEGSKRDLVSDDLGKRLSGYNSYWYVEKLKKEYLDFLDGKDFDYVNWLCFSGYRHAITERFLFRSDRIGMQSSIEARSPFLNHEMVELALSIPGTYKVKNGINKYILKKSLERILPEEILYRKKMGFCLPIKEWANESITNYVKQNISLFCKETGLLNEKEVLRHLSLLESGKEEYTNNIWTIYFFLNWYKKWF